MNRFLSASLVGLLATALVVHACCPAGKRDQAVLNADQTVVILWDPATKMQHFIRKASFKTDGDDFAFLVPSPTRPELNESADAAFDSFRKLTEPEIVTRRVPRPPMIWKKSEVEKKSEEKWTVKVLEEKFVAGFNATVLEASSAKALVDWLNKNGYFFSPQVEAWAKPYIDQGWKMTALKVAKDPSKETSKDAETKTSNQEKDVGSPALRMSFQTDQPLFPYREPDTFSAADALGARQRLLRIYFVADARYQGHLTETQPWTGNVAWSGKVSRDNRAKLLDQLKLPTSTGPGEWWLTEFEDFWPYRPAPADLTFTRSKDQSIVRRPPIVIIEFVEPENPLVSILGTAGAIIGLSILTVISLVARIRSGKRV